MYDLKLLISAKLNRYHGWADKEVAKNSKNQAAGGCRWALEKHISDFNFFVFQPF